VVPTYGKQISKEKHMANNTIIILQQNEHNESSVNLIKSDTVVKINYKYVCKAFYTFVLKEMEILKAVKSNKKYISELK
jgi:hypothetical protein